jgi:hypothetical protein
MLVQFQPSYGFTRQTDLIRKLLLREAGPLPQLFQSVAERHENAPGLAASDCSEKITEKQSGRSCLL